MNILELKNCIINGNYNDEFSKLYGDVEFAKERFLKACDEYVRIYNNTDNMFMFSAPGRTEVGGNHTDHEHGRVLTGSVNLDVIAIVCPNNDNVVRIKSEGYNMDEVDLADLSIKPKEEGKAISLIKAKIFKSFHKDQ